MQILPLAVGAVLLVLSANFAKADVSSYCTAYARDAADAALGVTGVGTLAGTNNDQWAAENTTFLDQCLALYGQQQAQPQAATQPAGAGKVSQTAAAQPAKPAPAQPAGKQRMKLIASAHAPPIASVSPSQGGSGSALQPGTAAWNAYCAKKYTSFNPATGTYKSYKGNNRRCVVTRR